MQGGGEGGEDVSIEELATNLSTYKDQLHQVFPYIYIYIYMYMFYVIVSIKLLCLILEGHLAGSTSSTRAFVVFAL